MKLHEYPDARELAEKLSKLTGTSVTEAQISVAETEGTKLEKEVNKKIKYLLRYTSLDKKEGTVTVTVQAKKWTDRKVTKAFDVEMETQDVENIESYTHKLPIHAFKSAIAEIIRGV